MFGEWGSACCSLSGAPPVVCWVEFRLLFDEWSSASCLLIGLSLLFAEWGSACCLLSGAQPVVCWVELRLLFAEWGSAFCLLSGTQPVVCWVGLRLLFTEWGSACCRKNICWLSMFRRWLLIALEPSWTPNIFIIPYHFSTHLNQFGHPEDGSSKFLRISEH